MSVILVSSFAYAQPDDPRETDDGGKGEAEAEMLPIKLEDLLSQMLARNPELQAARKRWEAKQKRIGQESSLQDPSVRFGWSSAGAPYPGAGLGEEPSANVGLEVSQMLPFPGKRGLQGSIAREEARLESFLFQGTELNLVSRLKSAYYELNFAYDAAEVLTRNKVLLERLAKLAEIRYAAGQASQQDLIRSQIETLLIETRLLEVERGKQSAVAEINSMLNRDPVADLGRPTPVAVPDLQPLDFLVESAMDSSPTIRARQAAVDTRHLALELSRREYYPNFEVMGGYFNQGSMKDMWEFRVQMNVPIFFARKQRLGVEESIALLGESQISYRAEEQDIRYRIRDRYLAAENSRRLMDLYYRLIIPRASMALESSLASYSSGSIDFLSVLSNFSSILENEIKYCESRTQYLKAMAALSELTGSKGEEQE